MDQDICFGHVSVQITIRHQETSITPFDVYLRDHREINF